MSKHTPGPWTFVISDHSERGQIPFYYESPGHYDNPAIVGANGQEVVGCEEYNVFNSSADARLIAAAPELLEALMASTHSLHTYPDGSVCLCGQCAFVRFRDAAIAKATGSET